MLPDQDPPAGWPKPSWSLGRVLTAVFFGLVTLVMVAVVVAAIATADLREAITFGLGAVFLGHVTGMSVSMLRRPRPATHPPAVDRTDQGEQGAAFRYSRWSYYWLCMVLGSGGLLVLGFAVVSTPGGSAGGWVLAVIAAAFAVFDAWFLYAVLRLAPGVVVLTPTGIYHRSLVLEHFVPWDGVVDVLARSGRTPWITVKAIERPGTRERRHTGRLGAFESQALPFMIIRANWLGSNALPAYRALKHYFEHPDQRHTLGEVNADTSRH
jgi:hypothetical protein